MLVTSSCTHPGTTHLPVLSATADSVEMGMATLQGMSADSAEAIRTRVETKMNDLVWLMQDSLVDFSVEEAQIMGDWVRVKRFLKDGPERLNTLDAEGKRCLDQLNNLQAAIRQGAEVDAEGTAMDEAYFARQVQREIEAVNAWRATLADTKRMVEAGTLLEGTTRASMDSLILVKRAEWAQQIAATE